MVRASGTQPRLGGDGEVRFGRQSARTGSSWQILRGDQLDLVEDEPEAVAEVEQRHQHRRAGCRREHEPHGVGLAPDRERVDLARGPLAAAIDGQTSSMCAPSTDGPSGARS